MGLAIWGAGIGGSSRRMLHAKHDILSFSLGKRSLPVLRFASCEAVVDGAGIDETSAVPAMRHQAIS